MAYTFDTKNANAPSRHKTQYFEMMGDHAIYHDGWIASTKVMRPPWDASGRRVADPLELSRGSSTTSRNDWTQSDDVAAKYPDKLKELENLFWQEAKKYQVLPLDASVATRLVAPRPSITAGRNEFTWTRPITGMPHGDAPSILNTSYNFTADIEVPQGGAEGMILTAGRPVRRLRLLPAQGQAGVPLEPGRSASASSGKARTRWRRASTRSSSTSSTTASASARSPSTT